MLPLEISTAERLYKNNKIDISEYDSPLFKNHVILNFDNEKKATQFVIDFYHKYLCKKYDISLVAQFSVAKISRENHYNTDSTPETWIMFPENVYDEVQDHLMNVMMRPKKENFLVSPVSVDTPIQTTDYLSKTIKVLT